jgi:hypothetical protein
MIREPSDQGQPRGANPRLRSDARGSVSRHEAVHFGGHGHCSSESIMRLLRDTTGNLYVEYLALYAFVGFLIAIALVAMGPSVVRHYSAQRQLLYEPSP